MVENSLKKIITTEHLVIAAILILAIFLRFYRLDEYMTFLGDEGRDALMMIRILIEHDFPLLGPPTSVGNIYLGPMYYYMMAISMWIWWLNPVAASAMVATIGVLTVLLIYYLARQWFGFWGATLSSFLYSVSFVTVNYSRFSWNPNPAPFFALLAILGFYQAHKKTNYLWLILTGFSVGAAIQMHYLALILVPILIVLWFFEIKIYKAFQGKSNLILGSMLSIVSFLFTLLPLIIFDIKYNFMNLKAIQAMFGGQGSVGGNILESLLKIIPIYKDYLIGRYLGAEITLLTILISILALLPLLILLVRRQIQNTVTWPLLVVGTWLIGGIIGISFYKNSIYDHYLGFLNPAPFLLLGGVTYFLKKRWQIIYVVIMIIIIGFVNINRNTLKFSPNNQLLHTQTIAKYIILKADNKPFNFALLSKNNYDPAYQFYLEIYGNKPKAVPVDITEQLFVVCEDNICDPINNPKYEIAAYGWAKISRVENIEGIKVYQLEHNYEGTPN